jgi:hypothetical protein
MKNSILFLFLALLFSSCMTQSGKYTAYSANSPEGQSWEKYKNGNSYLFVTNKTNTSKTVSVKYLFPERQVIDHVIDANSISKIALTRGVCMVDDHMNTPIRLDVEPYFEYKIKLTLKNTTPLNRVEP